MSSTDIPQGIATGEPRITQPTEADFPLSEFPNQLELTATETKKDNGIRRGFNFLKSFVFTRQIWTYF